MIILVLLVFGGLVVLLALRGRDRRYAPTHSATGTTGSDTYWATGSGFEGSSDCTDSDTGGGSDGGGSDGGCGGGDGGGGGGD